LASNVFAVRKFGRIEGWKKVENIIHYAFVLADPSFSISA